MNFIENFDSSNWTSVVSFYLPFEFGLALMNSMKKKQFTKRIIIFIVFFSKGFSQEQN